MNRHPSGQPEIRTDLPTPKDSFYTRYVKRFLDVVLSGSAILVLSPLLLYVKLLIRWVVSPHRWDQCAGEGGPLPSRLLHLCRGHCKWMGR